MRLGGSWIEFERFLRRCLGFPPRFLGGDNSFIKGRPEISVGKSRVRWRKVRIERNGLFELFDRLAQIFVAGSVEEIRPFR